MRKTRTTPLHLQSNAVVERFHHCMESFLVDSTCQDINQSDLGLKMVSLVCEPLCGIYIRTMTSALSLIYLFLFVLSDLSN